MMPRSSHYRGYTLVELIVSIAIFSVVMLVATAAFLTMISLDRQARATNDVVTNLSYVTDTMARGIRTGQAYACNGAGDCSSPGSSFRFTDAQERTVTYSLTTNPRNSSYGSITQCIESSCMVLTDPRINVEKLAFYVAGSASKQSNGDTRQPTVIFTIEGSVKPDARSAPVEFIIESGATQRVIDL